MTNSNTQHASGAPKSPAPSPFEAAAGTAIPNDAHEYHLRKALNDTATKTLDYTPYSSTMPVDPNSQTKFAWLKKK